LVIGVVIDVARSGLVMAPIAGYATRLRSDPEWSLCVQPVQ
jgi:hypothetical protein